MISHVKVSDDGSPSIKKMVIGRKEFHVLRIIRYLILLLRYRHKMVLVLSSRGDEK
jgi:hypothetical protein